jgi:hypothetical protein
VRTVGAARDGGRVKVCRLLDELFLGVGVPEVLFETDAMRTRQTLHARHRDRRPDRP